MVCRREYVVAYSLGLEVRMAVVICEGLAMLIMTGSLMLVRNVGLVIGRVEGLQLLLFAIRPC